ncbi:energy-coupling factor transporter ATPase [Caloramator sp. E03]|uniref:energy-coupling factor transporter ATPase n=1 Tax=Caloramator sp. E03 TaxID=2576307 RepID=UPI001110C33A|nr:energy-coupling factor transporter ATPase [Caloramator sp. E03]QCX33867.1 energy-coupling factor transporter ATPase [Caloramator sp. E03]
MEDSMLWANKIYFCYRKDDDKNNEKSIVLNGIDLKIKKGEFVVIIGHNGSGKSTLAKHFNAILVPTKGDVIVDGLNTKDNKRLWEIRQRAGMVFQNPDNQIVATIVEEDVAFGPENLGIPPEKIRQRVDEALAAVDMLAYAHHGPHLLSGGQKQRVAIAGVLAMRPECIILDEPTAMLDPSGRKEVLDTIKRLNKEEGITIVLITHFMEEAVEADRVVVMEDGKIILEGSPKNVFSRVEEIKRLGLDVPEMTELAYELRKSGIKVREDILTIEEMVDAICQLK